jgi:hypothetical protein
MLINRLDNFMSAPVRKHDRTKAMAPKPWLLTRRRSSHVRVARPHWTGRRLAV